MHPASPTNPSHMQTNQQKLTTGPASAASNPGTATPTDVKSSSAQDKASALNQINASTLNAGMVANPKGSNLPSQASALGNLPMPASASATQAPPPRPTTPAPQLPTPQAISQSATPSPIMMNKVNALIKSVSINLTAAQKARLDKNTATMDIGLLHMKQLKDMLSSDGAHSAKFTCVPDSQSHWGFKIQRIAPSDTSFHQKVMTQDEKAETYVGLMSIFDNQKIAGNTKLDDITMKELTSTLVNLENKIEFGEYITGADLQPVVSLILEDLSSPPLARLSTPADFAHMDLKEMKALKNLLKTAKSPNDEVIIRPDPQALSKVAIQLITPNPRTTAGDPKPLSDLKLSIKGRVISQTVSTLKNMLSKWETDRRISDDTKIKINLIKQLFDSKEARGASITVADLDGILNSITTDLK